MVFRSGEGLLCFVWRRHRRLERNPRSCGNRGRRRILSHRAGRQPLLRTRNRRALPASFSRRALELTPTREFFREVSQARLVILSDAKDLSYFALILSALRRPVVSRLRSPRPEL